MRNQPILIILIISTIFIGSCSDNKQGGSGTANRDTLRPRTQEKIANPFAPVDISPMDMSYFPADYPILKMKNQINVPPVARVIYSRPHLEGRHLFQDLLNYGEAWRLGANESSELQLYRDVTINDQKVKAGRYVIYCVPRPDKWIIHLNSNIDSWGLKPDSTKDLAHFDIPVQKTDRRIEYFTMVFEKNDTGAQLLMAWDNIETRLPLRF